MMDGVMVHLNWQAVGVLSALFLAWTGLLLFCIRYLIGREMKHMDHRFKVLEHAREENSRAHSDMERAVYVLREKLPDEYVKRDDWIRFAAVIDSKLNAIHGRLDAMTRGGRDAR